MRTPLIFLVLLFAMPYTFGQIVFEKGYIVDNDNNKTECLIKNNDWKNNPTDIEYKLDESSIVKRATIETIKEFGVTGSAKYVREDIQIDRSLDELNALSGVRNPEWQDERLFLKVLVEGKATLYYYEEGTLNRFFYSIDDSHPKQLVYKKYNTIVKKNIYEETHYGVNKGYQQQLWSDMSCKDLTIKDVQKVEYKKPDLTRFFRNYNACMGNTTVIEEKKEHKFGYHVSFTPGVNSSTFSAFNTTSYADVHFASNLSYSVGFEGEIILPYIKNKWGIIFNPTYQYLNATMNYADYNMLTGQSFPKTTKLNYNSIELPVGVRYYMFLNKDLKLFMNVLYIPSFSLNLNKTININGDVLDVTTKDSYALGGGVSYKRLSGEVRYYARRDIAANYISWQVYYSRFALVLGIKLF